jgi:hypothetical protein
VEWRTVELRSEREREREEEEELDLIEKIGLVIGKGRVRSQTAK